MRLRTTLIILGGLLGAIAVAACGANDTKDSKAGGLNAGQGGSSAGGSGFGGNGVGGSGVGGSGVAIDAGNSGGASGTTGGGDACAAETFQGETIPLDIYVMYDQSTSMTCPAGSGSRWSVVTPAFQQFLSSPQAAGIGVGIQYFGQGSECNAASYFQPDVPIAPLPANLQPLTSSLQAHGTIGINLTTTNPALIGAIDHAKSWKQQNPGHVVVVLLVTDGQPNTCGTVQEVTGTARNGFAGNPSIRTFVLGIVAGAGGCPFDQNPPNVPDLDAVAAAGGTDRAYVVNPGAGNAGQELLDALGKIRGSLVIPCQYTIPVPGGGQTPDPSKVNLQYTPAGGSSTPLYQVPDKSQCGAAPGGWYYDNPQNPQTIILCDATCSAVTQSAGGAVDVLLGCTTITAPPR